jgi:branched-subunit amino acid aminotransferase/4-amino-4-deoxychorismate lyase
MSAESPLPGNPDDFGLIETFLWTRAEGYWLAEGHRARIELSARELGFAFSLEAYVCALAEACAAPRAENLRVRLELRREGRLLTTVAPFTPDPPEKTWRVAVAGVRLDSRDPLLRRKTTRRAHYEEALKTAQAADASVDEVVFLNERDEICEASRANLFLPRGKILLTPPLSCGLLAGVLRANLLCRGKARVARLRLDDLAGGFMLGNALRGLFRANLAVQPSISQ